MAKQGKLGSKSESTPSYPAADSAGELAGLEIDFKASNGAAQTKYPWDKWFSGTTTVICMGRDYGTTRGRDGKLVLTNHMFPKIKTAARHRYKIVNVLRASRATDEVKAKLTELGYKNLGDTLIIKGRDMMADERIAEESKRAEEKVRAAELAAEKAANLGDEVPSQDEIDAAAQS